MIYDVRTYDLKMGKVQDYMDAVREVALPLRKENGINLAGWFYTIIGPIGFTWGFPLTKEDYDIERMFTFSVGNLN